MPCMMSTKSPEHTRFVQIGLVSVQSNLQMPGPQVAPRPHELALSELHTAPAPSSGWVESDPNSPNEAERAPRGIWSRLTCAEDTPFCLNHPS